MSGLLTPASYSCRISLLFHKMHRLLPPERTRFTARPLPILRILEAIPLNVLIFWDTPERCHMDA